MAVEVVKQTSDGIKIQLNIKFNSSMLESESSIQDALNKAGLTATKELLKRFDTDGSPICIGSEKLTSRGLSSKEYQTSYGSIEVERHIYQTAKGGTTYCPLENGARIIANATPRFAAQLGHKISQMPTTSVLEDLSLNHNRKLTKNVAQRIYDTVSSIIQLKEESWEYQTPEIKSSEVSSIGIGLDGTCMLLCDGWRQAMVGTLALYDDNGKRLHTTYIAAAPEYGKELFKQRFTREIERIKTIYPDAVRIGIADGAHDNWDFLNQHTNHQILDFFHATEYLGKVANQLFSSSIEKNAWLDDRCHELKHSTGGAKSILSELEKFKKNIENNKAIDWKLVGLDRIRGIMMKEQFKKAQQESRAKARTESKKEKKEKIEILNTAITYFKNNINNSRMNYAEHFAANHVIGSGVTEAACKTIVKHRLCQSGMRWKDKGAKAILSLRTLVKSTGRWEQFWDKINQHGVCLP